MEQPDAPAVDWSTAIVRKRPYVQARAAVSGAPCACHCERKRSTSLRSRSVAPSSSSWSAPNTHTLEVSGRSCICTSGIFDLSFFLDRDSVSDCGVNRSTPICKMSNTTSSRVDIAYRQYPPFTNQQRVYGEFRKKSSNFSATLATPACEGLKPSASKSAGSQTNPSERGVVPAVQRYGPHNSSGAALFA